MLKFYTPDRKGKQEPYSYRSRARLVGKCIENIGQASSDDIVVLGRIHTEKDVEDLNKPEINMTSKERETGFDRMIKSIFNTLLC